MALISEPDPGMLSQELEEHLTLLSYAVQRSVPASTQMFEREGLPFDATGHATFFRLHCRQFLHAQGLEVRDLENCGFAVRVPGHEFRVFKSTRDGTPPVPGDSKALLRVYNQIVVPITQSRLPGLSVLYPEDEDPQQSLLYHIIHWHTTRTGEFIRAKWACPKSATSYSASWYFDRELPNPVLYVGKNEAVNKAPALTDDLGFTLRKPPRTGSDVPEKEYEGDSPTND